MSPGRILGRTLLLAAGFCSIARAEFEPKYLDASVNPTADFFQFANGGWIKATPIPGAYGRWGAFNELDDRNKQALRGILERVQDSTIKRSDIEKQVGDFYASGMDLPAIEKAGVGPLKAELDRINAIRNATDLQAAIARLHRLNIHVGFEFNSEQDPGKSTSMIGTVRQAGLGLPDRDYYFREDEKSRAMRENYVAHIGRMLRLAGSTPAEADAAAAAIMKLETALARGSRTNTALRDPVANYHRMPQAELQKLSPDFDWKRYFTAVGLRTVGETDVGQPEFVQAFASELKSTPIADWKRYLRWHLIHSTAAYLAEAFVNENFAFYGKTLTGAQELRPRWKRVLEAIDGSVGEALGQLYVAKYFPPDSKARMLTLVANLRVALRERLQTLEWMDEPTRAKALAKLNAFNVKIGYPDRWIDYGKVRVERGAYAANVLRAREFNVDRELGKIGKPVDRAEWYMTPPTVNAYYEASMNEIVFPAGILQPPFFDAKADDAINYGAIGAVIGHEMTHGFDDQGRQYDASGNLVDWWSPESAKRFNERAAGIISQFSAYEPIPGVRVNGELTQGENIADLGGVKIAYAALTKAMAAQPPGSFVTLDGFNADQRFFLGWATIWRTVVRDEETRLRVNTDPHSPARYRVNGPLSNLKEFTDAFSVPDGAAMKRPAGQRVEIW